MGEPELRLFKHLLPASRIFLGLFPFGNVGRRPDHTIGTALFIPQRLRTRLKPSITSILVTHPALHIKGHPTFEMVLGLVRTRQVIRMHPIEEDAEIRQFILSKTPTRLSNGRNAPPLR